MDIIKKMRYILDRKQKLHICFLGVLIFVGGSAGDVERVGSAADRVCDHQPGAGIGK